LLSQDWSLGIELKGSVLMPFFIFLSDRKRLPVLLAVIVFFLVLIHNGHYYISFIIGVLIARYEDSCPAWFQQLNPFARTLILIFCLALYQVFNVLVNDYGATPVHYKCGWLATAIGCGGILLLVRFAQSLQQFLNSRPLVFLGRVSYSVYLLQMITVLCLLPQLVRGMNHLGVTSDPAIFLAVVLVSVVTTISCAAVTYEIIEVPAINTGHYLTKKIQRVFGR
jgi:peptidoglycan/LPS O-acetylase OafA/YrhL